MSNAPSRVIGALLISLGIVSTLRAEDARVLEVLVFKDNLALLRQEFPAQPAADGWAALEGIAPATMATVRVMDAATRTALAAMVKEEEVERPILNAADLLRANIGRKILQKEYSPDGKTYTVQPWEIVAILESPPDTTGETLPVGQPWDRYAYGNRPEAAQAMILLKSESGYRVAPIAAFSDITFSADKEVVTKKKQRVPRLFCKAPESPKPFTALVEYLTPGARWIPAYDLQLEGKDKAVLSLSAEVINDTVAWKETRVSFVGGVPHFRFQDYLSALSPHNAWPSLNPFLFGINRNPRQQVQEDSYMAQQVAHGNAPLPSMRLDAGAVEGAGPLFEGSDLHFYPVEGMTLPKSGRAKLPLWSLPMDCAHGFTLRYNPGREAEIRQQMRNRGAFSEGQVLDKLNEEKFNRVWHIVTLRNASKNPWTSGPTSTFQDGRPLAQETLPFTAPGAETDLCTTVTPDITYQVTHDELHRHPGARRLGHEDFEGITESWSLDFTNRRNEEASIKLQIEMGGEIAEFSQKPAATSASAFDSRDWGENPYNFRASAHAQVLSKVAVPKGGTARVSFKRIYYAR